MHSSNVYTVVRAISVTFPFPSAAATPFGQSVKQYSVNFVPSAAETVFGVVKVQLLAARPVVPDVTGAELVGLVDEEEAGEGVTEELGAVVEVPGAAVTGAEVAVAVDWLVKPGKFVAGDALGTLASLDEFDLLRPTPKPAPSATPRIISTARPTSVQKPVTGRPSILFFSGGCFSTGGDAAPGGMLDGRWWLLEG